MISNFLFKLTDMLSIEFTTLIQMGLRIVAYSIDRIFYEFIIKLYNLFRLLCEARIGDKGIIGELATRIGLILGLVMFFYVTFDFIQILIDPDKINDKEKGPLNIIKKFIIVIVLLGTSSFIFDYLHRFQAVILSADGNNVSVLERLILPYDVNTNNFGAAISSNFMQQFYRITDDPEAEKSNNQVEEDFTYDICKENAEKLPQEIIRSNSLYSGDFCLNARYKTSDGSRFYIDFNPLSAIVGIFVAWMLLMYCISVGMRVIQLAFLEIISPVAFVSYLSPKKDSMFGKFWKTYFATYIDVFIRVIIINFIVLLSGLILDISDGGFWESVGNPKDTDTIFWLTVFMILALLSFAKKAPDLIKKFLPESVSGLSFGVSSKDRAGVGIFGGALAGAVTGLAGGGFAGASNGGVFGTVAGAVGGTVSGTFRGLAAGVKGKDLRESVSNANKNQTTANLNYGQRLAAGGSPIVLPGAQARLNALEAEYQEAEDYSKAFGTAKSKADGEVDKHLGNYMVQNFMANGNQYSMSLAQLRQAINSTDDYDDATRAEMELVYNNAHAAARNLAMNDNGAIKSGSAVIDFHNENYTYSSSAVRGPDTTDEDIDINADISANMQKVLRSSHATGEGNAYQKAKRANDYYEQKVADKINDTTYTKRAANVKYSGRK